MSKGNSTPEEYDSGLVGDAVSYLSTKYDAPLPFNGRTPGSDLFDQFVGDTNRLLQSTWTAEGPYGRQRRLVTEPNDLKALFPRYMMTREGKLAYAQMRSRYPVGYERRVWSDPGAQIAGDPHGPYDPKLCALADASKEEYSAVNKRKQTTAGVEPVRPDRIIGGDPHGPYRRDLEQLAKEAQVRHAYHKKKSRLQSIQSCK